MSTVRRGVAVVVLCPLLVSAGAESRVRTVTVPARGERPAFRHEFDQPQVIYSQAVSPSGCYLLVWHADRPPRRLTIFRLTDGRQIADVAPGYGGDLTWTLGDKVIHTWGAGTDVRCVAVYDVTGAWLAGDSYEGVLPTDRGFYITFSTATVGGRIVKHDVNRMTETVLLNDRDLPPVATSHVDGDTLIVTAGGVTRRVPLDPR